MGIERAFRHATDPGGLMRITLKTSGLDELTRATMALPGVFAKARKRALQSTGNMVRAEVREFVEGGGENWPALHPLTAAYRRGKGDVKWMRAGRRRGGPLFFLGRFARYRVDAGGSVVEVDMGKSRAGEPGTFDPLLISWARRAEEGATIPVTPKMRRRWAASKSKLGKRARKTAVAGQDYFALRKSTQFLRVPKRPIFGPVFRRVESKITPHFRQKFWESVVYYKAKDAV